MERLLCKRHGFVQAPVVLRMRSVEAMVDGRRFFDLPAEGVLFFQHLYEVDDRQRVVPGICHVLAAQAVGFQLLFDFELQNLLRGCGVGNAHQVADARSEPGDEADRLAQQLPVSHFTVVMRRDVGYLVPDECGEFILAGHVHQDSAIDVNVAVGRSRSVDLRIIDHVEVVLLARVGRVREHALTEFLHVCLPRLVVVDEALVEGFLVHFLTGSRSCGNVQGDGEQYQCDQFTHVEIRARQAMILLLGRFYT